MLRTLIPVLLIAGCAQLPPSRVETRQIISSIIAEERLIFPRWELMTSTEWCEYMFGPKRTIPHSADGLNGSKEDCQKKPTDFGYADVTAQGRLLIWDRCSLQSLSNEVCRTQMTRTLRHESKHYKQWQEIAFKVLVEYGDADALKGVRPRALADIQKIPGAEQAVVNIFETNIAHYQCREVAVYGDLIKEGTISKEDKYYKSALRNMVEYYGVNVPGCIAIDSKHRSEFQENLDYMFKLLKVWFD